LLRKFNILIRNQKRKVRCINCLHLPSIMWFTALLVILPLLNNSCLWPLYWIRCDNKLSVQSLLDIVYARFISCGYFCWHFGVSICIPVKQFVYIYMHFQFYWKIPLIKAMFIYVIYSNLLFPLCITYLCQLQVNCDVKFLY